MGTNSPHPTHHWTALGLLATGAAGWPSVAPSAGASGEMGRLGPQAANRPPAKTKEALRKKSRRLKLACAEFVMISFLV
jgi:hypothetical protein